MRASRRLRAKFGRSCGARSPLPRGCSTSDSNGPCRIKSPSSISSTRATDGDAMKQRTQGAPVDAKAIDSGNKLAASLEQTERKLSTHGTSFERLARSLDPAYAAQQKME